MLCQSTGSSQDVGAHAAQVHSGFMSTGQGRTGNRHCAAEMALTQDLPHRCQALLARVRICGSPSMRVQVWSRSAICYGPFQPCRKRESSPSIAALLGAMCWQTTEVWELRGGMREGNLSAESAFGQGKTGEMFALQWAS